MSEHRTVHVSGIELAYREYGDAADPLVLCLHGFPDSPTTFRHLAPDLVAAGFRVVTPWLRGYPPSEIVPGPYQTAALARDVIGLADALSPERPAFLVGHDWGTLAAYGAMTLAPDRFARAVVLAVAPTRIFRPFLARDWDQQRASWYQFLFQLGPLSEAIVSADDFAYLDRLWESWSPGWKIDREALDAAKDSIRAGFPAALDFYRDNWQPERHDPALAQDQRRIVDGPIRVPTLLLHGLQDGCILPGAMEQAGEHFAAEHRIEALAGVGHFLHLEDPERVGSRIVAFLVDDEGG